MTGPTIIRTAVLALLIAGASAFSAAAQNSDVVYVDGWVDLKDSTGTYELMIGDRVSTGDTIITDYDGTAELEPQSGSRIVIKPNTVFTIKELDDNGKSRPVLSTTVGAVSFKFNRMTQEPAVTTLTTVAGIRGTEFTVYAGADGSSLFVVESGAVEVSSSGESVMLEPEEGVEIPAGGAPGEKFKVMKGKIDFAEWNSEKIENMMADPAAALENFSGQLDSLASSLEEWSSRYTESKAKLDELRARQKELFDSGEAEKGRELNKNEVAPLEYHNSRLVLNYRYYALSALSLRQHVLSSFYVRMKTAYISDRNNSVYLGFLDSYRKLVKDYEQRVVPWLVQADY